MRVYFNEKEFWPFINTFTIFICIFICFITFSREVNFSINPKTIFGLSVTFITLVLLMFSFTIKRGLINYSIIYIIWGACVIHMGNHLLGSAFFYTTILFLYKRFPVFKENRKAFFLLSIVLILIPFILIPFSKGTYIIKLNAYLNDFLLLYFVSLVLFLIYSIHKNKSIDSKKVLDLSRYNFSVRKIRILNAVMSGVKYSTIALNLGCGIATIKKNVGEICTTLQVADKTELLVKYSGYTIQC